MKPTTLFAAAILALTMLAPAARAQEAAAPPAGAHAELRAMFKVRIAACKDKAKGDACSFTGRDGQTKDGVCRYSRRKKLFCGRQGTPAAGAPPKEIK